jgi:hypothetical protein
MPKECLPDHLKSKRHDDWGWWPIKEVPRRWTAFCGKNWPLPELIAGDAGWRVSDWHRFQHFTKQELAGIAHKLDVPKPGHWVLLVTFYRGWLPLPMFAWTSKKKFHIRLALARWDYVDKYYQVPALRIGRLHLPD